MKKITTAIILLIGTVSMGLGWAAYQATAMSEAPLSSYVPSGALLYLQAKDFSALLEDWNRSPQKQAWLGSSNYEVFSRSRLLLRLNDVGKQFAAAAGLPPDMNFISQVAGSESALAALRHRKAAVYLRHPVALSECDAKPAVADACEVRNPQCGRSDVLPATRSRITAGGRVLPSTIIICCLQPGKI